MESQINYKRLVTNKEKTYFYILILLTFIIFVALLRPFLDSSFALSINSRMLPNTKLTEICIEAWIYIFIYYGFLIGLNSFSIGHFKNNGVRVTEKQLPELFMSVKEISKKMNLDRIPEIYVLQRGGLLNALTTKFFWGSKSFILIYSDILELALDKDNEAVEFVIAHELAHIQRKHVDKQHLLLIALMIPFLNTAYYRACEYTCDRIAKVIVGDKAAKEGLAVLCLGKRLFSNLNIDDLIQNSRKHCGFWAWITEKLSTHPPIYKRFENIEGVELSAVAALK